MRALIRWQIAFKRLLKVSSISYLVYSCEKFFGVSKRSLDEAEKCQRGWLWIKSCCQTSPCSFEPMLLSWKAHEDRLGKFADESLKDSNEQLKALIRDVGEKNWSSGRLQQNLKEIKKVFMKNGKKVNRGPNCLRTK